MTLPGRLIRGSVRPDRASLLRFASLRWAALPIIDRRWTAPMSAAALGFGLFVGVAIGPGTQGTQGASAPMVVQVPQTPPADAGEPPAGNGGGAGGADHDGQGGSGGSDSAPPPPPPSPPPLNTPSVPPVTTPPISPPVTTPPVTPSGGTGTTTTTEPVEEPTTALAGTVIHINPMAASYTIADDGSLIAIHSHRPPNLGKSIEVDAHGLANGTYVEAGNRTEHETNGRAEFAGTVSFSDPKNDVYTVSAPGVSLLVRGGPRTPQLGDTVEVRVRLADNPARLPVDRAGEAGCGRAPALPKRPRVALEQVGLRIDEGERAATTDVEAIVEGVCRDTDRLIVSADDVRESGQDIQLLVPKEIELGKISTGEVLRLTTNILEGGSLQLSTVAGDEGGKGADDADLVQP